VAVHLPSPAGLFIYRSCGKCPIPAFQWNPPHDTVASFPPPRLLGRAATPAFSGQLVYLQFCEGFPLLPSLALRVPRPLCFVSFFFCCCCLFRFFSLFSQGGGQSVQGATLMWPRVVCGSTMCRLAHLVVCFSRASRSWHLVVQEPSWFLHLPWSGDAMHRLRVWRSQSFASSQWFFLQGVSLASLQDFTLGSTLSASSL
jgi:hypothetical protein